MLATGGEKGVQCAHRFTPDGKAFVTYGDREVSFAEGDIYPYPGFMVNQPLEVMLHYANFCLRKKFSLQNVLDGKKHDGEDIPSYIWDNSYDGMVFWGVPQPAQEDQMQSMMISSFVSLIMAPPNK